MADVVPLVSALATRRHLGEGPGRAASPADADGRIDWKVSVDSTISRAHQHAAGARREGHLQKEPPGGVQVEPDDHGLGRSRGGFTTKTHLACDQGRKPLSLVITAGQRGDSPQLITVLERIKVYRIGGGRPRTRPDLLLADKAYTSRANRAYARRRRIRVCIPSKADQDANRKAKGSKGGRPPAFDPQGVPAASCRGMRHQPAQTTPGDGHPLRQARRPLRSHRHHRRHQPMASTITKHGLAAQAHAAERSRPPMAAIPRSSS